MYGSDSVAIHQLLTVASSLAPTAVHHNSLNDLVGACRKSHKGIFIDGMWMCQVIHVLYTVHFHRW